MDPRFAVLALTACTTTSPTPAPPQNVAPPRPVARATLPCFASDLDLADWHQRVRAGHLLVFDVVGDDHPPPGWPDGWSAGTCRVVPKYNTETTAMDFLVSDRGKTIASIGESHVDYYVRTPLPGPQPGERVGSLALRDCMNSYDVWQFTGNRLCHDDSNDRAYLVHTDAETPQPGDTIIARRALVQIAPRRSR